MYAKEMVLWLEREEEDESDLASVSHVDLRVSFGVVVRSVVRGGRWVYAEVTSPRARKV